MTEVQKAHTRLTTPPTLDRFIKLSDEERRTVYMHAYKCYVEGNPPRPDSRERLLKSYVETAGWDKVTVRRMRVAALTPIHQK
jgi:hypothetical protein